MKYIPETKYDCDGYIIFDSYTILEALQGSIKKWERIAYEGARDNGCDDCALCQLMAPTENCGETYDCSQCPLHNRVSVHRACAEEYFDYAYRSDDDDETYLAERMLNRLYDEQDELIDLITEGEAK